MDERELIRLSRQHAFRLLLHLKNVIAASKQVAEYIDDIVGIYSCDVLFFDALNEAIRREIERDGKTIYEKACS
ncbi:UNVERIFIED_ORG: hypothetical protein BDK47_10380 [Anoxybacillus amylolyticus]|nr:hypothetical protein B23_1492 [Geobacillus thermoleovorans B23]